MPISATNVLHNMAGNVHSLSRHYNQYQRVVQTQLCQRQVRMSSTAQSKWQNYYTRGAPPWDTQRPSSQLQQYLGACVADLPSSLQDGFDTTTGNVPASEAWHVCSKCAHLKPPYGGTAIEFACGTGASSVTLAAVAHMRVVGVDIVEEAVASATAAAEQQGVASRCSFVCQDVFNPPSPDFFIQQQSDVKQVQQPEKQNASPAYPQLLTPGAAWVPPATPSLQDPNSTAGTSSSPSALARTEAPAAFDFCYDCQAFHALRDVDEAAYVALLRHSLKPGGLLYLIVGRASAATAAAVGPALLTEVQLRTAFPAESWQFLWLLPSQFDSTPHYELMASLPAAWCALIRRL